MEFVVGVRINKVEPGHQNWRLNKGTDSVDPNLLPIFNRCIQKFMDFDLEGVKSKTEIGNGLTF